jgi:hypothetical protein
MGNMQRKTLLAFLFIIFFSTIECAGQKSYGKISCIEYDDHLLTHQLTPAGPVPTAFDPDAVYPYVSYAETSDRPILKKYHFIVLENDHLKVMICPDLGGKVFSMKLQPSGKEDFIRAGCDPLYKDITAVLFCSRWYRG